MKKKIILCIAVLGLLTGCGKTATLSNGEDAVVTFEDGTMFSIDEIWEDIKDKYALTDILNKIDLKILKEEYADDLDDMESYVSSYETYLKSNYTDDDGNYDESSLLSALANYGYSSLDVLLDEQRISYLTDLATTDYAKTLVTEKEIKAYYKSDIVGDIHCVHILVTPESSDTASDTEAKEKAQEIIDAIKADIKSGTSAEDAFAKYADSEEVTYQDLDYFNKGDMVEAFETAAYELEVGEYSTEPVKTTYGYHIILKLDEKEKDTLDNVRDEIIETLAEDKVDEDDTLEVTAMVELRKEYGVTFEDDDLEEQYNRYINNLLNS